MPSPVVLRGGQIRYNLIELLQGRFSTSQTLAVESRQSRRILRLIKPCCLPWSHGSVVTAHKAPNKLSQVL
jgi:hypothetical protein